LEAEAHRAHGGSRAGRSQARLREELAELQLLSRCQASCPRMQPDVFGSVGIRTRPVVRSAVQRGRSERATCPDVPQLERNGQGEHSAGRFEAPPADGVEHRSIRLLGILGAVRQCRAMQTCSIRRLVLVALAIASSGCNAFAGLGPQVPVPQADWVAKEKVKAPLAEKLEKQMNVMNGGAHNHFVALRYVNGEWEPIRNAVGVKVGKKTAIDALSRAEGACYLWHYALVDDDGHESIGPREEAIGDIKRGKHPVDCAALPR
jgi:hypothetical protein